jgi:chemotaxis protein MotB
MRRKKRWEEDHEQLDRWLISYADFLTLMFTFFAALYALSTVDKEKIGQFSNSLRLAFNVIERPIPGVGETKKPLMAEISKSVANIEGINVKSDPRGIVVTLSNDTAFMSGSADIKDTMAPALDNLAEILKKNPGRIVIEGHTDNVPISGGKYASNWELSTARAASVLNLFLQQGLDPNRFIIAGYGEYRPLASGVTNEGRAKNRRVEIVLAPVSMR